MKERIARVIVSGLEWLFGFACSGPLVNLYSWALDVAQPTTPAMREGWERDSRRRSLLHAAEDLAGEPFQRWYVEDEQMQRRQGESVVRCISTTTLADDLRRAAAHLYPDVPA
jgi:hypothetical protein